MYIQFAHKKYYKVSLNGFLKLYKITFFQCFTHRYLGWKINVLDSCDVSNEPSSAASEKHEVYVEPAKGRQDQPADQDLEYGASVAVASKVTPPEEFLHQQHVHHSHREYSHRYPHHTTSNSKLSASHHHPQLLTNANNNYDRLQSSSSSSSSSSEKSYEARLKDAYRVDEEALQQQQHRPVTTTHEQSSSLRAGHLTELGREQIQQQTATNQQLSNLVADHQRPTSLNHGTKLSYVGVASNNHGQLPYSRAPHYYASNYHPYVRHQLSPPLPRYHHQHEPPRTQLMIIRRPVTLTRRPMLQTLQQAANMITTNALSLPFPLSLSSLPSPLSLPSPPRSIFIERKKSVYRPPATTTTTTTPKTTIDKVSKPSLEKSTAKIDTKQQRAKLEAKIGSDITAEISDNLMDPLSWTLLKPARNTGFDPDSIVIEGGFKPIIRNVVDNAADVAQKKTDANGGAWHENDEQVYGKRSDYRSIDKFSPVFIPSLPVTTSSIDGGRKRKKKTSPARFSPRFDDLDDMEMAADLRLDTYYLPPFARTRPEQLPSSSSSGVLITYDGKKLKDSTGLARSISNIEHRDSKGRLTSDLLSRTPQFGKFQGELPPLIPGEMRTNDSSYERKYRLPDVDLSLRSELLPKTRLTLVERTKRSSPEGRRTMSSTNFQRDNSYSNNQGRREREQAVSGGAIRLIGNLGSIVLITIVAYCAI